MRAHRTSPTLNVIHTIGLASLLLLCQASAENSTVVRTIHAPAAAVEQALKLIHADSDGRLPTLRGFVNPGSLSSSDRQARYDYDVEVTAISPTESSVRVNVEITAWHEDDDPGRSGYRELTSNGRLEEDLFERLEEAVQNNSQPVPASATPDKSPAPKTGPAVADGGLPDSPSASKAALLLHGYPKSSSRGVPGKGARNRDHADSAARRRELEKEEQTLAQVQHNQVKPNDLAVVKEAGTRIRLQPADDGKVILVADAEDEFQVLERHPDWVRLQLSGPARGWVRAGQLDLSEVSSPAITAAIGAAHSPSNGFLVTRRQTSSFPGDWKPLRGKTVRILWVQRDETNATAYSSANMNELQSLLRKEYADARDKLSNVAGLVIVLDSADGGMMATTVSALSEWRSGKLSSDAFWHECWFDPPSAFSYVRRAAIQ